MVNQGLTYKSLYMEVLSYTYVLHVHEEEKLSCTLWQEVYMHTNYPISCNIYKIRILWKIMTSNIWWEALRKCTLSLSLFFFFFYGKGKQSKACWWTSLFSESGKATLCVLMHVCKVYLLHYCVHVGVNSFVHLTLTMGKQCGPLSLTIKKEEEIFFKKINIQTMTYIFP